MEQLIYIEQTDKNEASKMASGFTLEETKSRTYINALGCQLGLKYLAQENISVSNIYNLHNIHKIREEFDVADIMLPNIHIDVRMVYDENLIFIPKSHFEFNLVPDIYLVFKMAEDGTHVEFFGFFEPKLINKNNKNNDYYFIEKEKLSHPSDLKSFIENYNGNTTETLTEDEIEDCKRLAISLIDHDINNSDKKNLIKMLVKSASLRENLTEFDNFEFISYHTATGDDFANMVDNTLTHEIINPEPVSGDEFDVFDNSDELFETNDEVEESDDIFDELNENNSNEDLTEEIDIEEFETDLIFDDNDEDTIEDLEDDNETSDSDEEITEEETETVENFEEDNNQDILSDNTEENLPEEIIEHTLEEPDLELPEHQLEDLYEHEDTFEDITTDIEDIEIPESFENFETTQPEQEDIINCETISFDNLNTEENVNAEESEEYETEEISNEVLSFEDIEHSEESVEESESEENLSDIISFEELDKVIEEDTENSEIHEEFEPETVSLEELENAEQEDYLDTLPLEEQSESYQEVVSYENSTIINNEEFTHGEIPIDINFDNSNEEKNDDELEKLEVLYNENNTLEDVEPNLDVKTNAPEKGKKAIIFATAVVTAIASLLIYAAMNKSNNEIADQNNNNVLEKNLPGINNDVPNDEIEKIIPSSTPATKLEEAAKQAKDEISKPKTPAIESPYIDVKKLSWAVPDYVSYNDSFKQYLQTAGKSLKLSLSSDLLLATEYAYSNLIQVNITLSKEGVIKDATILQSSGSAQIDNIVLRTVKDTLNVVKAPSGVIVGDNIHLTLKIYL